LDSGFLGVLCNLGGESFALEVKHQPAPNIIIMLTAFAGRHVDRGLAAPVVTRLHPEPGSLQSREADIHSHPALQDAGGFASGAGVGAAVEQVAAGSEVANAAAEAYPGAKPPG
jgi:hypothetical protein